jgi:Tol biopolymer transport system component
MRVSADGGPATAFTTLSADDTSHRFPRFLPDGRQFLFFVQGKEAVQGIYLASLDDPAATMLTQSMYSADYHPDGWLFYARDNALVAQRFDLPQKTLLGEIRTVVDNLANEAGVNGAAFSLSTSGLIAYRPGGSSLRQMTWFDRTGKSTGTLGPPLENANNAAEVSPDGTRVSIDRFMQGQIDVWIVDRLRATRLTFDPGTDHWGQWSPDGSQIAFDSTRNGTHDLYIKASSGAGEERLLLKTPESKAIDDWSPDGTTLLFTSEGRGTDFDLWYMPADGTGTPQVFLKTPFIERYAQFSPDGRWVAYMSNEPGRPEIYLRPFPGPGGQWQVSSGGGVAPRWHPKGDELFYLSLDLTIMSVPMAFGKEGPQPADPMPLFKPPAMNTALSRQQYDVGPDGRFLINAPPDADTARPVTLLLNWSGEKK